MNEHQASSATLLGFDTSTGVLAVSLYRAGEVLDSSQAFTERNHSVRIIPEIQEMLARHGLRGADLNAVAVGQGPGSYTGVRIAVSAAKTLAWAWDKPLIGLSSLEILAYGAWSKLCAEEAYSKDAEQGGRIWIVPIMDARRGQVYGARFAASGRDESWSRIDEDGIRMIADWSVALSAEAQEAGASLWFVGETGPHAAVLAEHCPAHRILPYALDARAMGKLAVDRLTLGLTNDIHSFAPNYTQLTEAEVKLRDAQAGRQP